jgi:hypothetical protein
VPTPYITNPGFEDGATGWILGPSYPWLLPFASIVAFPHTGSAALRLARQEYTVEGGGGPSVTVSGFAEQVVTVPPGQVVLSLWTYGDAANGTQLAIYLNGALYARTSTLGAGWRLWAPPAFTPSSVPFTLRVQSLGISGWHGVWLVDDLAIGTGAIVARHRHAIIAEAVTVLKTIAQPTYWTALGGRVYTRFRAPSECAGEMPILFVVEHEDETPIDHGDHMVKAMIHLHVIGFVKERSTDSRATTTADDANKLSDDVRAAFLRNPKLGGKLGGNAKLLADSFKYGMDPEFGAMALLVELPYYYGPNDIGPNAV